MDQEQILALISQNIISVEGEGLDFTVYALWDSNKIVYVGKSTNLHLRIGSHKSSGKVFDGYSYIRVSDRHEMDSVESFLIRTLSPKYNKTTERAYVPLKTARKRAIEDIPELVRVDEIHTNKLAVTLKDKGFPIQFKGKSPYIPMLWLSRFVGEIKNIGVNFL